MRKNQKLQMLTLALLFLSACSLQQPSTPLQPLPSPSGKWSVHLTQSGGFAGVTLDVEVSSDGTLHASDERSGTSVTQELPAATVRELGQMIANLPFPGPGAGRTGCADCYEYDLSGQSGRGSFSLHEDDTTMDASRAKDLIVLLRKLRNQALGESW